MNAANKKAIGILGAFLVTITGKDDTGGNRSTKQMVYVTEDNDRMFLNKEACIKLGLISDQFPKIGEINVAEDEKLCDCPRRQKPPPLPDKMPMAPTEDNVPALRKWLLEYYGSSTFNVCDHQTLPHMEGPPMRLHIDPDAIPKAVHKPRPVPLHWKAQVEAELERDVRLGVIERAPIGKKAEWTAPMHITSKKNGEPRRTVDFQSLNAAAGRETHHTRSPFHQAMSVPHNMKKTVLDAWNGYHSVPVREEDRKYLTFITEWGRFRYRTAPPGLYRVWRRIYKALWRHCSGHPKLHQVCRWLPAVGSWHREDIPGHLPLAGCLWKERNRNEPEKVPIRPGWRRFRWIWDHQWRCKTVLQAHTGNQRVPDTKEHHRHPSFLRNCQPGVLHIRHDEADGTVPWAPQTKHLVLLGRNAWEVIRWSEERDRPRDRERSEDFW